jgi:hypothetical protein
MSQLKVVCLKWVKVLNSAFGAWIVLYCESEINITMAATPASISLIRHIFPRMLSDMENYRALLSDQKTGGLSGIDKNITDAKAAWAEFNKTEEATEKPGG